MKGQKINKFLKQIKKQFSFWKKKRTKKSNNILNNIHSKTFKKRKKTFVFKAIDFKKFKVLWNNITHYYTILAIFLISLGIYVIFWPIFKVKNIEIIKQDNTTSMIIAYKAVENFRWDSIFTVKRNDILKKLTDYQQNIKDIKIDIILPNTLKITIDSYDENFNTTINDKSFILTYNGTLIPSMHSKELPVLNVLLDVDANKFLDYKKLLDTPFLTKINLILKSLDENIINFSIQDLDYYVVERELHIISENGTRVIFDLQWDVTLQIRKLAIFHKEHINFEKSPLIYIDLRIKNKIFYCDYENEYDCKQNLKSIYEQ